MVTRYVYFEAGTELLFRNFDYHGVRAASVLPTVLASLHAPKLAIMNRKFRDNNSEHARNAGLLSYLCVSVHLVAVTVYYLVEDGFFGADEAPLEGLFLSVGELDRQTDVEQLTVVVNVGVVAVDARLAREGIRDVRADRRRVARQPQRLLETGCLSCHLPQSVLLLPAVW